MNADNLNQALSQAVDGEADWVRVLLDAGADPNGLPLVMAIQCGETDIVQMLLDAGAEVNRPFYQTTPLVRAVTASYPDVVALLLQNGADTHQAAPDGTHPVQAAYTQARRNATAQERKRIIEMLPAAHR